MTETIAGRRRLGRGLEALLGPTREEAEREGSLVELAIADIRPNPYQPRRDVDPAALEELKASILKAGLLQPVVVRAAPGERASGYELIAGERRLRACQALGWDRIPAVQRDVDDRTVLALALIENLQRDDPRAVAAVAKEAVDLGLSVRAIEDRVRGGRAPVRRPRLKQGLGAAPEVRRIEDALRRRLGTDVRVTLRAKGKGQIHVNFYSNDDLARLLELILGAPFDG